LRKADALSIINLLLTVICILILFATWLNYRELLFDEFKRLITEIIPFTIVLAVSNTITTFLMAHHISQVDDKSPKIVFIIVQIRSILAVLLIGVCVYPAVQLSGFPQHLVDLLASVTQITSTIKNYLTIFISWIASGILGWIGNILLGAMGSALWTLVQTRLVSKKGINQFKRGRRSS
jgi:hypothetical protein